VYIYNFAVAGAAVWNSLLANHCFASVSLQHFMPWARLKINYFTLWKWLHYCYYCFFIVFVITMCKCVFLYVFCHWYAVTVATLQVDLFCVLEYKGAIYTESTTNCWELCQPADVHTHRRCYFNIIPHWSSDSLCQSVIQWYYVSREGRFWEVCCFGISDYFLVVAFICIFLENSVPLA